MKQWYEELFANYANRYEEECYIKGTSGEVDFIEKEIGFKTSATILDIGCGTGRHSIELARRGYTVTGIDLSDSMLAKAREKASAAGVNATFLKRDAREFSFPYTFDLAIMLCEGAFPLMETDEMNFMILRNAFQALKHGGKFIFTTLNGLFPLYHSVKDFIMQGAQKGTQTESNFDLMTFRDNSIYKAIDDSGREMELTCNERYYVPSEITWLLKSLGFSHITICGCAMGKFSRERKLTTDDFEMLVVAEK
jgi:2-polyprenyl-3-methyl-5-hydroxy-6-metoxy-1,4-benzoquinol methylase